MKQLFALLSTDGDDRVGRVSEQPLGNDDQGALPSGKVAVERMSVETVHDDGHASQSSGESPEDACFGLVGMDELRSRFS